MLPSRPASTFVAVSRLMRAGVADRDRGGLLQSTTKPTAGRRPATFEGEFFQCDALTQGQGCVSDTFRDVAEQIILRRMSPEM